MKHVYYLCFWEYVFLCGGLIRVQALCPYPDLPSDGKFTPHQEQFDPGDEVTYSCKKGFVLAGKERRKCMTNGVWSDHTPFCDPSVPLSDPSITNRYSNTDLLSRVIDGRNRTCFDFHNATGQHLYVHLAKKVVVRIIRIFLKKGATKMQILTGSDNNMNLCEDYHSIIETDRWMEIKCKSNVLAKTVKILVAQKIASFCEIEVYGKEEDSCDYPPDRTVTNGHFVVTRSKATLICEEGYYKSESNRLVCERNSSWIGGRLKCDEILCHHAGELLGGEWTFLGEVKKLSIGTTGKLRCFDGYQKTGTPDTITCSKNGTWTKTNATCVEKGKPESTRRVVFCTMGIIIALLIIGLLAATIHFIRKQRNKEVVVVYQSQCDGSVPLSESEIEYRTPRYEPLLSKTPEPPSTPRPMAKLSTMSKGGYKQKEYWKDTLMKQTLPPDLGFGTMKASTIYGN